MGRVGCGAVCHVRELDGGVRVARGERVFGRGFDILERPRRRGGGVEGRKVVQRLKWW
jgi:hypothetical protein